MSDLAIPVALGDDGRPLKPTDAESGRTYRAPCCAELVRVHKQDRDNVRSPVTHFQHLPGGDCAPGESRDHKLAKALVELYLSRVSFVRKCSLGDVIEIVRPEGLPTQERRIERTGDVIVADVAVVSGDAVVFVVEVFRSHAVDAEKKAKLGRMGIPWVEIRSESIIDLARKGELAARVQIETSQSSDRAPCETCAETARRYAEAVARAQKAREELEAKRLEELRATPKQISYLRSLGYEGPLPTLKSTASELIENMLDPPLAQKGSPSRQERADDEYWRQVDMRIVEFKRLIGHDLRIANPMRVVGCKTGPGRCPSCGVESSERCDPCWTALDSCLRWVEDQRAIRFEQAATYYASRRVLA